jgi:hypothetical protein
VLDCVYMQVYIPPPHHAAEGRYLILIHINTHSNPTSTYLYIPSLPSTPRTMRLRIWLAIYLVLRSSLVSALHPPKSFSSTSLGV